jgi:peptide subunit release factor 1 (eRF1)
MVSLILPNKKQISDVTKLLNDEQGKAANIKDRTNRQSVVDAMVMARESKCANLTFRAQNLQ